MVSDGLGSENKTENNNFCLSPASPWGHSGPSVLGASVDGGAVQEMGPGGSAGTKRDVILRGRPWAP